METLNNSQSPVVSQEPQILNNNPQSKNNSQTPTMKLARTFFICFVSIVISLVLWLVLYILIDYLETGDDGSALLEGVIFNGLLLFPLLGFCVGFGIQSRKMAKIILTIIGFLILIFVILAIITELIANR